MKRPAFQFYPSDWRKDMALQSCSVAARGLWIDMMCIAHECDPYGHLTVNGKPMTPAQVGRHTGLTQRDCERLLAELAEAGVSSMTSDGAIYSRRMVRDEDLRNRRAEGGKAGSEHGAKGAEHGIKGGRPANGRGVIEPPLEPPPSSSSSPSGKDLSDEAKASSSSAGADLPPPPKPKPKPPKPKPTVPCPYDAIVDAYHAALPSLPKVRLRDGPTWADRQKAMRSLWGWVLSSRKTDGTPRATNGDEAMSWVQSYFRRASENDFVMGRTKPGAGHEGWVADFDFVISKKGLKQVIEKTEASRPSGPSAADQTTAYLAELSKVQSTPPPPAVLAMLRGAVRIA